MSLDIDLVAIRETEVYSTYITHNLGLMADKAGIYEYLWNPEETGIEKAADLVHYLKFAIEDMKKRPDYFKQFDAPNGWGTYKDFVPWLERLLEACEKNPDAKIEISK